MGKPSEVTLPYSSTPRHFASGLGILFPFGKGNTYMERTSLVKINLECSGVNTLASGRGQDGPRSRIWDWGVFYFSSVSAPSGLGAAPEAIWGPGGSAVTGNTVETDILLGGGAKKTAGKPVGGGHPRTQCMERNTDFCGGGSHDGEDCGGSGRRRV